MARTFLFLRCFVSKLFLSLLSSACAATAAYAQTPAAHMMPDGSKDLYVGLGVSSRPSYQGSDDRTTEYMGLLQMQWSNGIFVSGPSLGMHLSSEPSVEYGPLLALEPGRSASGPLKPAIIGGLGVSATGEIPQKPLFAEVRSTVQAGGFFNYYIDESFRVTSSFLYGADNDHNGVLINAGVQKLFAGIAPHHNLSLSAGITWANSRYNQAYFGVVSSKPSVVPSYLPSAGIRDVQLGVNWNWELSPMWLLTSTLSFAHLMAPAAGSPLTERHNNTTVRTGLAYRF